MNRRKEKTDQRSSFFDSLFQSEINLNFFYSDKFDDTDSKNDFLPNLKFICTEQQQLIKKQEEIRSNLLNESYFDKPTEDSKSDDVFNFQDDSIFSLSQSIKQSHNVNQTQNKSNIELNSQYSLNTNTINEKTQEILMNEFQKSIETNQKLFDNEKIDSTSKTENMTQKADEENHIALSHNSIEHIFQIKKPQIFDQKEMFIFKREPILNFNDFSICKKPKQESNRVQMNFDNDSKSENQNLTLSNSFFTKPVQYSPKFSLQSQFNMDLTTTIERNDQIDLNLYNSLIEKRNFLLQQKIEREKRLKNEESNFLIEKQELSTQIQSLTDQIRNEKALLTHSDSEPLNETMIENLKSAHSIMCKLIIDINKVMDRFKKKCNIYNQFTSLNSKQNDKSINQERILNLIDELNDLTCQFSFNNI